MRRMRKLCTLGPHIGDAKELEVVDAMDAEDHGESVQEFLLERDPHGLRVPSSSLLLFSSSV